MPPKKNINKTSVEPKIPKEKVSKPRIKKEKLKLKIPTVLKVKIPILGRNSPLVKENVVSNANTGISPPSPVKMPTKKMLMLDRINEVAKAQLVKNCPVMTEMEMPEIKKRGRKKKIQPDSVPERPMAAAQSLTDSPSNTDIAVEKKKRVWKRKKIQPEPEPVPVQEPTGTTEVNPKKKVKESSKVKPSSNGVIKKPKVAAEKSPKKIPNSTKPVLTRKNPIGKTVKKKSTKGKTGTDEVSSMTSSSVLSQAPLPAKDKIRKSKVPVKSIKNNSVSPLTPVTSASELKDTSGTSATPTDTIRKDKKTPVIKKAVKRKCVRRKTNIDEDSTITSPSILSQCLLEKTYVKEIQKPSKAAVETISNNTDSRRTSVTTASEWSWTKDISGSSTTTCITVCSTDFVRIDGKLPFVKLNNCDAMVAADNTVLQENKESEHALSEVSSSSSSSSSSDSSSTKTTVNNFLNLSTSSVSPTKSNPYSPASYRFDNNGSKEPSNLEKVLLTLKKVNLGSHDWDENAEDCLKHMESYEASMFTVMKEEHSLVLDCMYLSQILSDKCFIAKDVDNTVETVQKESDFAKPSVSSLTNKTTPECPRRRDSLAYEPGDDDDALSLFAESLTGFDSSRVSSRASLAAEPSHEEYVPQPVRDTWAPCERTYRPSKIQEDAARSTKRPVCEKQNADSTSLHKEPGKVHTANVSGSAAANSAGIGDEVAQKRTTWDWVNQQLTIWTFKPLLGMNSQALSGVCFFNLISNCKRKRCRYLHRQVDERTFGEHLVMLGEEQFVREFLLVAKFSSLRLKYMGCFVAECQRRELPKILVEMVIAYITASSPYSKVDAAGRVETVESALLYLNNVDLSVCEDRLKYRFDDGRHLCDVFMETIANTQNFWRFKPVFLALAGFMARERRHFRLEVAAHILERVCIFRFEQPLALVLLSIIELTNAKIYENPMMSTFEKQLRSFSSELHARFVAARGSRSAPEREREPEPAASLAPSDPEHRYTSPDTTNLDSLNKPIVEPVITRTINLDKVRCLNAAGAPGAPHRWRFTRWNQQSIFDKAPGLAGAPPRPPLKRPLARQPQYGPRQCKYPRRSADFYGQW